MNQTMPQQASVFQKITEFVQAIIDRFLDGRRLSPELSSGLTYFSRKRLMIYLKEQDAVTNTGAVIRDAVDELQAMRIDLEKLWLSWWYW